MNEKWIDVKDSLPEENKIVLAFCVHVEDEELTSFEPAFYQDGEWMTASIISNEANVLEEEFVYKVTHWMSMPTAPKEKS